MVLSPDHSEPSLTATTSFGVRTFLASCGSTKRDRLIHFSPQYCLFHRFVNVPIGHPTSQFAKLTAHVNNTIRVELSQQTHGARDSLIRYTPPNCRTNNWESLCATIFFPESKERFEAHQRSCVFGDIIRDATEVNVMSAMKIVAGCGTDN